MKKIILIFAGLFITAVGYCRVSAADVETEPPAVTSTQNQYRQKWYEAKNQYNKEYAVKAQKNKKSAYGKMYFDLGKQYYFAKDYPAAMVCFGKVITVENFSDSELSSTARKFLDQIKERLPEQIEEQYSIKRGKDFSRFKEGVDKILEQYPLSNETVVKEKENEVTVEVPDEIKSLRQEINLTQADIETNKEKMRLQLQKDILLAKQEIEKIIFEEKTRQVQDQLKGEQLVPELKRLYEFKDLSGALAKAQEILKLDPRNPDAVRIKRAAEQVLKEEELAKQKRETEENMRLQKEKADEQARLQKEKERIQTLIAARLKEIKVDIFNEQFQPASEKIKEVLSLDPENKEALSLKKELKRKVKALTETLLNF